MRYFQSSFGRKYCLSYPKNAKYIKTRFGEIVLHSKFVRSLSYLVLVSSLAVIFYFMFKDLNWILGNDELFLRTTMIGEPCHTWMGRGRLWSLGLFDYSILLLLPKAIGQTIEAHFDYNIVMIAVAIFSLYHFFNKVNEKNYGLSLFFVLILLCSSSFAPICMNCTYPERMMFLIQVLFMYFWLKGYQNNSMQFYFISWIFCTYLIFSKEPVSGAVLVVALINLIFGWNQLTEKDRSFHFLQIFSTLIYFGIYIYRCFYSNNGESEENIFVFSQRLDALNTIFIDEPILGLVLIFAVIRAYFVFVKTDRRTLFIDSLLFGSVIYAIVDAMFSQTDFCNMFPSLIFAFPSLVFWTDYLWKENKFTSILIVLLSGGSAYLAYDVSKNFAWNTYRLRNNDIEVVDFIADSYINGKYIYFFTNGETVSRFRIDAVHGNVRAFDIFTHFVNYSLQKKNYLRDSNILRPLEKLEYAFDDSVILCSTEMNQKYKDYLGSRGFKVLRRAYDIDVYAQQSYE